MNCPICQFENPLGSKFCNECGHKLPSTSTARPQSFSLDEKFEKIQRYLPKGLTDKILNQRDKIEGERRQVTVMFCDMVGFTPLVEKIGPVKAYGIMDQVYEIIIRMVYEFEGTINQMTGDGAMALFGAPIALEDAPQRALWSALSIHREISEFSAQNREIGPIRMRIGINTGPVVVGTLGKDLRVEFNAVGDTVNLASRVEGLAEPGTTYITEETFRLTKELFRFKTLGKKAVKGKKRTIPVYSVQSAREDIYRPRLGSERMIYSDMVGRDSELNRLELQVMKVINGEGSVINIIGEAGIGKSRLVAELKKREIIKKVNLFEGRAISIGRNLSFHPIIDLLKQWAQIREDDGEAMAFAKLEAAVRNLFPDSVREALPFIAILMGMQPLGRYAERIEGIEGEALKKLILKNVRELLIKATELTPLIIVSEDLHWADTSSIEVLESLFHLAETQRILFINVFRPGFKETGDRIIETITEKLPVYYVEITLNPLNEKMSEALINNILKVGELHHAVFERIVQRVGGNPFFIEEIVRSLIDNGAVVHKNGGFQITDKISTIAIPNTINDVLMARIDRLEEVTRDLVKVASVIGRSFFYRILKEVTGACEDLDNRLSYLKKIQLIRDRKRMGEIEYLFKHALAQEATYESILPDKRKELHLKVAVSIEKVFGERLHEFYGMLAYHYSRAENLDKAEEYLIKAGEEALKSSASIEALNYYQEALDLYLKKYGASADPEKIAMLDKNIALAFYNRGQYVDAVEYFDKALNYYWGELPNYSISKLFKFFAGFFALIVALYLPSLKFKRTPTQRDTEIFDLFLKKGKVLSIINPKRLFIESFYFIKSVTDFDLTKFKLGLEIFMGASALFSFTGISFRLSKKILVSAEKKMDRKDEKQLILYDLLEVQHNYFEGNWKAIKKYDDELVNQNLNIGEIYFASQHLFWHGLSNIYQGSLSSTEAIIRKLNDIYTLYENDLSLILKQVLNTSFLVESRIINDALAEIEEGINFAQKISYGLSLIHMYACYARINILAGAIEKPEKSLLQANKIRNEVDSVPWQLSHFYKGQMEYDLYCLEESIRTGNKAGCAKYRKKAFNSCTILLKVSRKVAQHRTESHRLMGVYYWLNNQQNRALKCWNKSIEEGNRLGAHLELSRTYYEVGKRLKATESRHNALNGIKADEYLERARVMYEEMNLQWDSDQLGRVINT